jgi:CRP-like cAMP-binding protein
LRFGGREAGLVFDRAALRLVGPDTTMVDLAMRRRDIADYLALTIETVSRTLKLFKEQNLIKIHKL